MPSLCRRSGTPKCSGLKTYLGVALTAAAIGATACSSPPIADPSAVRSTAAGATASSPVSGSGVGAVSEADVLTAYRRFWAVAVGVGRHPERQWRTRLDSVTTDPFLSELLKGLAEQKKRGTVDFGTVEVRPTIAALTPRRASILDCQDASRSGEIDRDTGEVTSVGSSRTSFTATLIRDSAGRWKVAQARYLPDPC